MEDNNFFVSDMRYERINIKWLRLMWKFLNKDFYIDYGLIFWSVVAIVNITLILSLLLTFLGFYGLSNWLVVMVIGG